MTTSTTSIPGPSLAQPTIDAIQQQITALLPSGLASVITAQFAGAPVQPSTVGALPAMAFSSGASAASTGTALAQPTINAIQQQITALLPSDLASAITSQFAGAPAATSSAVLPTPSAVGAALTTLLGSQVSPFLLLPQAT